MSFQSRGKQFVYSWPAALGWDQGEPDGALLRRLLAADTWARFVRHRGQLAMFATAFDGFSESVFPQAVREEHLPEDVTARDREAFETVCSDLDVTVDPSPADTSDPRYYRVTQWIFLQLLSRGLVRPATRTLDVCTKCHSTFPLSRPPDCPTGSGTFEEREVLRWYLLTESYGERLFNDIAKSRWSPLTRAAQRELLGRRRGVEVTFAVSRPFEAEHGELTVFTSQIEAIHGATFLTLDPFHPALDDLIDPAYADDVDAYRKRLRQGLEPRMSAARTGGFALNPASLQRIPIVITPLANTPYSDGAVMAVPGHDRNFFVLAQRFRLQIREVIHNDKAKFDSASRLVEPWTGDGVLTNSGQFTSLSRKVGRDRIISFLSRRGICRRATRYRFRRLPISGAYPWGAPVPVVHCGRCGPVGIPESELPLEPPPVRPEDLRAEPTGLAYPSELREASCPSCGGPADRDPQTIQPWLGRAWSFLRPLLPHLDAELSGFRSLVGSGRAEVSEGNEGAGPPADSSGAQAVRPGGNEADGSHEDGAQPPEAREADEPAERPAAEAGEADTRESEEPGSDPSSPESGAPETGSSERGSSEPDPGPAGSGSAPDRPAREDALAESPDAESGLLGPDPDAAPEAQTGPAASKEEVGGAAAGATEGTSAAGRSRSRRRGRKTPEESLKSDGPPGETRAPGPFRASGEVLPVPAVSTFQSSPRIKELLGTRFITKFLFDLGECPIYEPFHRFATIGPVSIPATAAGAATAAGRAEPAICFTPNARLRSSSLWRRWVAEYGADAVRLHLLFLGALDRPVSVEEKGVRQMRRLIERIRRQVQVRREKGKFVSQRMLTEKHMLIYTLTGRLERWSFHTAVAAIMRFVRFLGSAETSLEEMDSSALQTFIVLLSPFAPRLAAELWGAIGQTSSVDEQPWPVASEELVHPPEKEFLVLVNGKIRDRMQHPVHTKAEKLESSALQREAIRQILEHRRISKVIVVPQRLVSIVLEDAVEETPAEVQDAP